MVFSVWRGEVTRTGRRGRRRGLWSFVSFLSEAFEDLIRSFGSFGVFFFFLIFSTCIFLPLAFLPFVSRVAYGGGVVCSALDWFFVSPSSKPFFLLLTSAGGGNWGGGGVKGDDVPIPPPHFFFLPSFTPVSRKIIFLACFLLQNPHFHHLTLKVPVLIRNASNRFRCPVVFCLALCAAGFRRVILCGLVVFGAQDCFFTFFYF